MARSEEHKRHEKGEGVGRKLNAQTVGNIGMFYVCYQLARRCWNVMPTTRNAKGVDVLIYSEDGTKKLGIQVKALSRRAPVPLGKHLDNLFADFVVVCSNVATDAPECFILTSEEVKENVHRGEKDERVGYWLQPSAYRSPRFKDKWNRIGQEEGAR